MRSIALLLRPKWISLQRPSKSGGINSRTALLFFAILGLLFWIGIYQGSMWLCTKCLGIEDIGDLLLQKVLSMVLLTFFSVLCFSNLITSFSTFFLADDLQLLQTTPVRPHHLFLARFFETQLLASWMIIVFGLPLLLAYGQSFSAGLDYYLHLFLVTIPFITIPTALAVLLALVLGTVFPARRTRDLMVFLFVLGFAGLYLYIRMLRPERFADPSQFGQAIDFLGMLRDPSSALLPSDWAVGTLFPLLSQKGIARNPWLLAALYLTAGSLMYLVYWTYEWLYITAFSRAQSGRKLRQQTKRWVEVLLMLTTWPFSRLTKSVLAKEARTFTRNPGQWAQLLLLGSLIVVYVFNFSSLRQISSLKMHGLPAFLAEMGLYLFNLLLLGFVVSAVAVRFAFPAVSLEGKSFWLIKQSPISMFDFLRTKFWSIFLPLLVLAEIITLLTNIFIRSSWTSTITATLTVFLMTLGVTGMGIGLGALYPRFDVDNPAKVASGFGGVLYMICSMIWIALLIGLELLPLRHILWARVQGSSLSHSQLAQIIGIGIVTTVLSYLVYRIPMQMGANALERRE